MNNRVLAIIQARMGSTRLPGKVMKELYGKTVLAHVIERVSQIKLLDDIVIATTVLKQDDIIAEEARKCGVKYFRGSEENLLSRYYKAARKNEGDIIVRITSDCPLIDPHVSNEIIDFYLNNNYTLVTNGGEPEYRTYPRGLDTAVFSFTVLEEAYKNATEDYQLEHVTPYIYENYDGVYYYKNRVDYSKYRLTLDEEDDWRLIKAIYHHLYKGKHDFYLPDIIKLLETRPELAEINRNVEQKKIK